MTNPAPTPFQPNPGPAGAYPANPTPQPPAYRGTPVPPAYQQPTPQPAYQAQQPAPYGTPNPADTGSFGWAVLGFFIPLAGLILFLVWRTEKPLSAKKAGVGALTGVLVTVALYALIFVVSIVAAVASAS